MGEELRCLQMSTQECRELPAMSSGLPQSPRHEKPLGPPKFGMPQHCGPSLATCFCLAWDLQEPLWADMETDGSAGNATARKPSSKAKSHTTQNIPIQEAAQSPGGSALPPHMPSPPRPPPTGNMTAGLGADHADEPEVVHQPVEQLVPLRRSTRERRPPERLGDYVQ
ncbi:hypothetical protein MRX96_041394 [Rhipicephalus microplus]